MDRLIGVAELAQILSVPKSWVWERTRKKEIPFFKLGRYCRFELGEVEKWLNSQKVEPKQED